MVGYLYIYIYGNLKRRYNKKFTQLNIGGDSVQHNLISAYIVTGRSKLDVTADVSILGVSKSIKQFWYL